MVRGGTVFCINSFEEISGRCTIFLGLAVRRSLQSATSLPPVALNKSPILKRCCCRAGTGACTSTQSPSKFDTRCASHRSFAANA